MPTHIVRCKGK